MEAKLLESLFNDHDFYTSHPARVRYEWLAGDCACLYCLPARRLHYIKEVEIRTDELKTILSASKSQRANISKNHGSRNQVYQSMFILARFYQHF